MRILIGGILQESNTFSPGKSTLDYFRNHVFLVGEEMDTMQGIQNEIGGFYKASKEDYIDLVPTFYAHAISAGITVKATADELISSLLKEISNVQISYDGILLALHGAMVAEGMDDVEGEILKRVRDQVGTEIPIVTTLDLHGNVTKLMLEQASALVGFKTYPHIDSFETGYRAAKLLISMIQKGTKLHTVLRKVPMIVPAESMQTTHGPMSRLMNEALQGEQCGDSVITSLFPVQPWLDVEELGFGIVVVSEDAGKANKEAARLADLAWKSRHDFDVELWSVDKVVQLALQSERTEPYIVSDSADSPSAGSTGDSNFVLQALLRLGMQDRLHCLLHIVDAPAVEQCIASGVGNNVNVIVGHNIDQTHGKPIQVSGVVRKIGEGKFTFGVGYFTNLEVNMGQCAVLEIGKLSIILMERPTFSLDPGLYRCMGLEPKEADLVLVKSANQFRACYKDISSKMMILDTPGASPANLLSLQFKKLVRPFYPFEDFIYPSQ